MEGDKTRGNREDGPKNPGEFDADQGQSRCNRLKPDIPERICNHSSHDMVSGRSRGASGAVGLEESGPLDGDEAAPGS